MEKENFDEELRNRIKQIFDDYDDVTADKGWDRLREKFPEKKHRDYFFWWIAAAALLSGVLLFWFSPSRIENTGSKMVKQQPKEPGLKPKDVGPIYRDQPSKRDLASTKTLSNPTETASTNTKKTPVKTVSPIIAQRPSTQLQVQPQKTGQAEIEKENRPKPQTDVQTDAVFTGIKTVSVADSSTKKAEAVIANPAISSQKKQQEIIVQKTITTASVRADSLAKGQKLASTKTTIDALASRDSLGKKQAQLIAKAESPVMNKKPTNKKAGPTKKLSEKPEKFSLNVYAGTHLNFAVGSNNQLGLGAGFSTDFRVAKNLKLTTGLGLLQNNLSYGQTIPANSQAAATSYAAVSAANATLPGLQSPSLKSMDAHLLALDIPLNLTYTFLPGKNSIAFSAGVSSNTFAREVYDYHYIVSNAAATFPGTINTAANTQNLQSSNSFSNFNFAKTLNLAAGFAYPLGKNKLQIEPFLKYPLGGNGSQQLKFGSVGVNLKITFQSYIK